MSPLEFTKDIAIILAGVIAVTTFFSGVLEYVRQGREARASSFVQMRRRFLESPLFRDILNLLASDSPDLGKITIQDRRNFVGFFEEVALMVNSKLIRKEIAHYMFGYYAVLTDESVHFWDGLNKPGAYWAVFRKFAAEMRQMEKQCIGVARELMF